MTSDMKTIRRALEGAGSFDQFKANLLSAICCGKAVSREAAVRELMREVGCKDNLLGYPMVERAINLVLEDESYLREVCGKLYPVLCEEQPDRAARSIKRVVEAVFDGIDQDTFQRYFSGLITMNRDIPTNAQFIARMANIIRDRM